MAVQYRLTLAGDTSVEQIAARAFPDPTERPMLSAYGSVLNANLKDRHGFTVSLRSDRNGYFDAISDVGQWEWELDSYVNVGFWMSKDWNENAVPNMVDIVDRLLTSGSEDAAFTLDGNLLLLIRTNGVTTKHNRRWWDNYSLL